MNILFYQPYNQAVPYIESVGEQFVRERHNVFFLTHDPEGIAHENFRKVGCKTYSLPIKRKFFLQYYFLRIWKLTEFCRVHNIDAVYSHFQEANLISVIAQYFCRSTFIINRHHTDCAFVDNNVREKWGDKIINRLSKIYIATSPKVQQQMVEIEKTAPSKVKLINYGYKFDNLPIPDDTKVKAIRNRFPAKLLLVQAARYIPEKRHELLIDAIQKIISLGFNVKLLLLGKGPLEKEIESQIKANHLEGHVFQLGFQSNIMDYYAAADLIVHFSISEASNSAIKEAALADTPVAVCSNVGDFDDYIVHEKNGFLLDYYNPATDLIHIVSDIMMGEYNLEELGRQLHSDVVQKFDIKNVIKDYQTLNSIILNGFKK